MATRADVPDHVTWVEHVQRVKVVVDGVADDHLPLQDSEDLQEKHHRRRLLTL